MTEIIPHNNMEYINYRNIRVRLVSLLSEYDNDTIDAAVAAAKKVKRWHIHTGPGNEEELFEMYIHEYMQQNGKILVSDGNDK